MNKPFGENNLHNITIMNSRDSAQKAATPDSVTVFELC